MRQTPLRGRPTRQEAVALDARLRDAAIESFVANGFDGTTMEAVATAAGITKRTLYAKYPDKQALFAAVIPPALASMPFDHLELETNDGDLRAALRQAAHEIVARLVRPDAVRLRRFAMLEAQRIAALDQAGNADLWTASLRSIVHLLSAHAAGGEITVHEPEAAANLFVSMVAGGPTIRADMGVIDATDAIDRHVDDAVELFLHGIVARP